MQQNCNRLLRLINNLIDITKIDSGFMNLNLKNNNIISIVEDITLSIAEFIKSKNIRLQFDTDVEEKIMACDNDKIERIILNLLSNSVKFSRPNGNIWVTLTDKGENLSISIKDDGIGIPIHKQNIIFQRFRQVDELLNRNREGSGIGLSLVKSLVNMHGGDITLISEENKGCEFIVTLPAKVIDTVPTKEIDNSFVQAEKVEKVCIEFSDIYS